MEIAPQDLLKIITSVTIIDVRQPYEYEICHLEGSINIPLTNLSSNLRQIPEESAIVTICHHGVRSLQAAQILTQMGYTNVCSLRGGIDAWAVQIDPAMPRY